MIVPHAVYYDQDRNTMYRIHLVVSGKNMQPSDNRFCSVYRTNLFDPNETIVLSGGPTTLKNASKIVDELALKAADRFVLVMHNNVSFFLGANEKRVRVCLDQHHFVLGQHEFNKFDVADSSEIHKRLILNQQARSTAAMQAEWDALNSGKNLKLFLVAGIDNWGRPGEYRHHACPILAMDDEEAALEWKAHFEGDDVPQRVEVGEIDLKYHPPGPLRFENMETRIIEIVPSPSPSCF